MKPELSIVIPTYNEAGRIGQSLQRLSNFLRKEKIEAEVLVVDANSPDGTAKIVRGYRKLFDNLKLINAGTKPKGKFIKGKQVKRGALEAHGKYILFMDADLATPLRYIKLVLKDLRNEKKIVICVRDLATSHKGLRKLISTVGNILVQMLLLPGIPDSQCGFKAFSYDVARVIFPLQTIDSWGFDMEILALARKMGYKIELIKVTDWRDIQAGSKIRGNSPIKASLQTLGDLLKIRWQLLVGRYKIKQ